MPRTVPAMANEVPGNYQTGALWNANVKALGDFLENKPIFSAYATVAQSIPNNVFTGVLLDTEVFDPDGGHSTTTNTDRYTCQVAGVYLLTGLVVFPATGTGTRGAGFSLNGATTVINGSENLTPVAAAIATTIAANPTYVRLDVGDYVSLAAYQNNGSALSTSAGVGGARSTFNAEWIAA